MVTRLDDLARLLGAVIAGVRAEVAPDVADLASEFAAIAYRDLSDEDLLARSVEDLTEPLLAQLDLARVRAAGTASVRVHNPPADGAGHTAIDVVTDDMPFLVDSLGMEANRHGAMVQLVVHPVVRVVRDAAGVLRSVGRPEDAVPGSTLEAFLHLEVDRRATEELDGLQRDVLRVLSDVREATDDWRAMERTAREIADELERGPGDPDRAREAAAFLRWLADDNFTFLGYREYELGRGYATPVLDRLPETGLGILRPGGDPGAEGSASRSFALLAPEARERALDASPLVLTKANARSTVHRPVYLDYVGVKRFDDTGAVVGERRFLGLYSSAVYTQSARDIPLVREKFAAVIARSGLLPSGHSAKDLTQVLETYPRDELFAISVDELFEIAMGIVQLHERQRVRLFLRRDPYGRFISCLVFVPRDRYTTAVRRRVEQIVVEALGGTGVEYTTRVSESMLARFHFLVTIPPGSHPTYDVRELEARVRAATRSWDDELQDALLEVLGEPGRALVEAYRGAFPLAYEEDVSPTVAVHDIQCLEALDDDDDLELDLYLASDGGTRFKIYRSGGSMPLSAVVPVLESLGAIVVDERPYQIVPSGRGPRWVYDFGLRVPVDASAAIAMRDEVHAVFARAWRGDGERDTLNRLVFLAGLTVRDVEVLRGAAKYLRQTRTALSQQYMEDTLAANPEVVTALVRWVRARHDLRNGVVAGADQLGEALGKLVDDVATLDEDRILRMFVGFFGAVLRTNAYREGDLPAAFVFKLDSSRVPELPDPRPRFEIFVVSARVEGVHMRAGYVARGGIRWSDRREDFRTEVLDLMRAQSLKNAVIVPTGAKGGFVLKRATSDPATLRAEIEACYTTFIAGLLEVTDNLVDGEVVRPAGIACFDEAPDAYLVVAADRGTATLSDLANRIATERGFWLGDAFASGGSTGFDHKKMGITARGAWESVRRHLREMGRDADRERLRVVGIGDMSGDVFGNGMLLSRNLELVAAFDHRHVFVDPDPDPERSFAERRRLFDLPGSSWNDYDRACISPGGGVWPRSSKHITLEEPACRALGIDTAVVTAPELIRAILRAPVDLLWNGGIGTFVKASAERDADAADRANDEIRVDGRELRCHAVAEGGNLGFTQRGRVEYALHGGRINTDAIDNSAGVDTSDHEVNVKILLADAVRQGRMTMDERNAMLASMTDEIAEQVLDDNREQNLALTLARALAQPLFDVNRRCVHALESAGILHRELEGFPDEEELTTRAARTEGLTSPELAVLLAHTKSSLAAALVDTTVPDDAYFRPTLHAYFPSAVRDRFVDLADVHPLRREITATTLANEVADRAGSTYVFRFREQQSTSVPDIVRAYFAARDALGAAQSWTGLVALSVEPDVQTSLLLDLQRVVERAAGWLLRKRPLPLDVTSAVRELQPGVSAVAQLLPTVLVGEEAQRFSDTVGRLQQAGVPPALARSAAGFPSLFGALDIVDEAKAGGHPVQTVAECYFALADRLHLDRLRDRLVALPRDDRWQAGARSALRDSFYDEYRLLVADVLRVNGPTVQHRLESWWNHQPAALARYEEVLGDIEEAGSFDLTTLSVAVQELRTLRIVEESD